MVRFIDQMSIANSEKEDIRSFGRNQITLAFIEYEDFICPVCHLDKSAVTVVPRKSFGRIDKIKCGSSRQCRIQLHQIIQCIPTRLCRAAEQAVVFDGGCDPLPHYIKKSAKNQDDHCCGDRCMNSA